MLSLFSKALFDLEGFNSEFNPKDFNLRLALPGLSKSDVDVKLSGNILEVSVTSSKEGEYFDKYRNLCLKYFIHKNLNTDKVSAEMENGLLVVHIPLKEKNLTNTKKIDIK